MNRIKKTTARAIALAIALASLLCLCCACAPQRADALDYSKGENWAYYSVGEGKAADLFLICPTVDMGKSGEYNMSISDEVMKESFVGALNMERGIYEDFATMYAPYYRQMTFPAYSLSDEEMKPYLDIAYRDVAAAFEYYFENCNEGRPIVLAGFSQGSQLLLMLLEEYFDEAKYSEKLVAAYCIGWRITEDELARYPHLKMAQGEDDTGVIVSFNSEAEGIDESIVVPKGVKTLGINPLNWKTDSTPADKSLNLGACFTKYSGEIKKEVAELTGAYLDESRGTLRVTDVDPSEYKNSLFPDGVYHLYDYQFFFRNLQENIGVRLASFLQKAK